MNTTKNKHTHIYTGTMYTVHCTRTLEKKKIVPKHHMLR